MFHLGRFYAGSAESRKYAHLFSQSLTQSVAWSLQDARRFNAAHHVAFDTRRNVGDVTPEEIEDITEAMQAARVAYLDGGAISRLTGNAGNDDLRSVLTQVSLLGGTWEIHRMDAQQVAAAVRRAVMDGTIVFVPVGDDLRACMQAIQKDRQQRPAPRAQNPQDQNPYATVQQMMGKPPRMPSGPDTPLGDAQPFDYSPDTVGDDVTDLAARGVSEADEAECYAQFMRELDECKLYSAMTQDPYTFVTCKAQAFVNYNQCRGY